MKTWIVMCLALFCAAPLSAAETGVALMRANNDLTDKASLQNGARLFMNYCAGCHSTKYQRYERVATDLGIPPELMKQNLIFDNQAKIGDLMTNAMPEKNAAGWFGAPPPDLTLEARLRSPDWIYTYLHSFYADPARPFGVNNTLFPNVGMPHVLEELQGTPEAVVEMHEVGGQPHAVVIGTKIVRQGEMNAEEYDQAVRDITNFLEYSGEPMKQQRKQIGYWVFAFLVVFFILAYLLKKEYWRDVH
ncbi:Cytochrome b/c1 [Plesiomonas shigelloides]|uniref:Ubiquinol--cytochrome c reductase, cytochrome c1 n=2 Tax=Plesiomonas shigelloides TaxID=703 RepID=R8AT97_PLESH|nr:cytochrome c1 [Plesiomonas shigelloides]MDO4688991.1 cytochrome c1 [Plesiomonas sp.]EON89546.1 ubiquinol--cytochrome c reductase, cytochrome c1 [Plesiomonas shigelloides 302-73]KAB7673555.1 cytochrome c1 [Plesiomonas shigelloides]KAB7694453.1 cytochrome c1 [Plesiomonas shigelloides]KAB7698411.1 cytochrome c1 [Plesiomonas shigelloides]